MIKMLKMVKVKEGMDLVDQLAAKMFGDGTGEEYNKVRAKVSYYLNLIDTRVNFGEVGKIDSSLDMSL